MPSHHSSGRKARRGDINDSLERVGRFAQRLNLVALRVTRHASRLKLLNRFWFIILGINYPGSYRNALRSGTPR